jgi:hypothetical protein
LQALDQQFGELGIVFNDQQPHSRGPIHRPKPKLAINRVRSSNKAGSTDAAAP